MPVTVELAPEIEARYVAEAAAQALPLAELLRHVVEERAAARSFSVLTASGRLGGAG